MKDVKYKLLDELCEKYGDDLLNELALLVDENGQGDCYMVKCWKYCGNGRSCLESIKCTINDLIRGTYEE